MVAAPAAPASSRSSRAAARRTRGAAGPPVRRSASAEAGRKEAAAAYRPCITVVVAVAAPRGRAPLPRRGCGRPARACAPASPWLRPPRAGVRPASPWPPRTGVRGEPHRARAPPREGIRGELGIGVEGYGRRLGEARHRGRGRKAGGKKRWGGSGKKFKCGFHDVVVDIEKRYRGCMGAEE
ncbi:translation initiation factor IF-2-like [Panicum virgatum]|uniref:translation initiation factor IF-2-like n=1 Tax=Panicum virgatum TaxID=38727 RepID=UPI0019D5E617|nr:translation initiation factor IF-2-like [Panicum virgatum]